MTKESRPCKFYAKGKCRKDNCAFSHEGPPPAGKVQRERRAPPRARDYGPDPRDLGYAPRYDPYDRPEPRYEREYYPPSRGEYPPREEYYPRAGGEPFYDDRAPAPRYQPEYDRGPQYDPGPEYYARPPAPERYERAPAYDYHPPQMQARPVRPAPQRRRYDPRVAGEAVGMGRAVVRGPRGARAKNSTGLRGVLRKGKAQKKRKDSRPVTEASLKKFALLSKVKCQFFFGEDTTCTRKNCKFSHGEPEAEKNAANAKVPIVAEMAAADTTEQKPTEQKPTVVAHMYDRKNRTRRPITEESLKKFAQLAKVPCQFFFSEGKTCSRKNCKFSHTKSSTPSGESAATKAADETAPTTEETVVAADTTQV